MEVIFKYTISLCNSSFCCRLKKESRCPIFKDKWPFYEACGTFINQLEERGRLDAFLDLIKADTDNINRRSDLEDIVRNLAEVDKVMRMNYLKSMSADRYEVFYWEAIKCCLPLRQDMPGGHEQVILEFDPTRIALLATQMRHGKQVVLKLPNNKDNKDKKDKDKKKGNVVKKPENAKGNVVKKVLKGGKTGKKSSKTVAAADDEKNDNENANQPNHDAPQPVPNALLIASFIGK